MKFANFKKAKDEVENQEVRKRALSYGLEYLLLLYSLIMIVVA